MLATIGFLILFLGILLSVMLHEGGHFLTARRFGMKATQFFVGFGPTLWSTRRGETEYGVKALPVGGFVKIVGMTPLEEVEPGDEDRAFYKQPAPQRTLVLAAGSLVHFVLAVGLVFGALWTLGIPDYEAPVVGTVSSCVPAEPTGSCDDAGALPAPAQGQLASGDRITAVNGERTDTWREVVVAVRAEPGSPVRLTVERGGEQREVTLTPVAVQRPSLDGSGEQTVGAIGVAQGNATRSFGPLGAAKETGTVMGLMLKGTYNTLTHKLGSITKVFSPDRDPEGFVGVVGAGRVSGEVLAADEQPLSVRIENIILLLAGVNLFVGIFNLLPLLPLDGGHIAILGFEQLRDRIRRLRGYRGPLQRVDLTKLMPVTYAVVVFFAAFTLLLLGADIVNPIRLTQ